jgi:hypothetical protein
VTATFIIAVLIMLAVRGQTTHALPFYGVGVFMPITVMGLAVRRHIKTHFTGRRRTWGVIGATFATVLAAIVFVGQIVGKWSEGGWVVLISFSILALAAHGVLISPVGYRDPRAIHRIVRDKARVQGAMASIVEWQSLKMQEYRWSVLSLISRFFELFGVRKPLRYSAEAEPVAAGDYDHALHVDHPEAPSILEEYLVEPPQLPEESRQPTNK